MKIHIALALLAVVLLTALYALVAMGYIDVDRFGGHILKEYRDIKSISTITVPEGYPVNTHKAGKDQR